MTSVSSANTAALLILQRPGSAANANGSASAETDLVKIANGAAPALSGAPDRATTQAAAAAAKFAVDAALPAPDSIEGGYNLPSDDGLAALIAERDALTEQRDAKVYELATGDPALARRMAAAANAKPIVWSEDQLTAMMDAFDALSIKHGRDPLHPSMRASVLRSGGW